MTPLRKFMLIAGLVASCLCNGAVAAYLDFTDDNIISSLTSITDGFKGEIDGIGFTLTSTDGLVNFNESYDGSANTGCQSGGGPLMCDSDGAGIGNDEITGLTVGSGQTLSLVFDTEVYISSFDFLDLYVGTGTERATVTIDGGTSDSVDANLFGTSGDGGYAHLDLLSIGTTIEFTAPSGMAFRDDGTNDYAFAAITVSAVPIPATAWLFGTALLGFIGFSRRTTI
jgi:hypothetical protein